MPAEWIVNPRRAPRSHARCRARIVSPVGAFEAETEDIGSHGCQVVSPWALHAGQPLALTLSAERLPDALALKARVAWASTASPFRLGVAFAEAWLDASARWFERLVAASGLPPLRRLPDRIAVDAMVYLGAPPRFLVDFTRDEARLLRAVGSGTSIGELRARLRDGWGAAQRALFSLLAHQHLTLSRGASIHPESWRRILGELEASLAIEDLRAPVPPLPAPPLPARPAVAAPPARTPVPEQRTYTPVPGDSRSDARTLDRGAAWAGTGPAAPDFQGAGVGWRTVPRERSPEAQGCFELALAQIAAGRVSGALVLLRRALALAPGDPEIAAELGKLAFQDRPPGR